MPGTPLIAVVAPAERDVLASITRLSWTVGVSATVISAFFCAVVWLLAFALRDNLRKQTLLTDLTRTDPLTGLCNRRALDIALADEWERLQRGSNGSLSILFIDADHFKQYNDRHGHAEGDTALRFLAECIRTHAAARRSRRALRRRGVRRGAAGHRRKRGRAGRGGDSPRSRTQPARRVRGNRAGLHRQHRLRDRPSRASPSVHALSHQADMALYRAKREGRNRVCCAETEQHARVA